MRLEALTRIRRSLPRPFARRPLHAGHGRWQLLDELKSEPSLKRLPPTVMMTAWPRPVNLPQGVSLLRKPFEWDTLVRLVRKHCGEAMVKCMPSREVDPLRLNVAAWANDPRPRGRDRPSLHVALGRVPFRSLRQSQPTTNRPPALPRYIAYAAALHAAFVLGSLNSCRDEGSVKPRRARRPPKNG